LVEVFLLFYQYLQGVIRRICLFVGPACCERVITIHNRGNPAEKSDVFPCNTKRITLTCEFLVVLKDSLKRLLGKILMSEQDIVAFVDMLFDDLILIGVQAALLV